MTWELSLVVPCYNEAARIPLARYARFLETQRRVRLCFVDDGSRDGTRAALKGFCTRFPESAELVALPENRGKAEAVRAGMARLLECAAHGGHVGFWDADLATPLEVSLRFLDAMRRHGRLRCVFGSRRPRPGARIERTPARHAIGCGVALLIRQYLRLPIYDTQCGAKVFHRDDVAALFGEPFVSRWLFDVELFKRMLLVHPPERLAAWLCEMPLTEWRDVAGSKLRRRDGLTLFRDLVRIALSYHRPRHAISSQGKNPWHDSRPPYKLAPTICHENPHR